MKFIILRSIDDQFYFVIKARNGEVVATSEMYKAKQSCKKGIKSISLFPTIVDLSAYKIIPKPTMNATGSINPNEFLYKIYSYEDNDGSIVNRFIDKDGRLRELRTEGIHNLKT